MHVFYLVPHWHWCLSYHKMSISQCLSLQSPNIWTYFPCQQKKYFPCQDENIDTHIRDGSIFLIDVVQFQEKFAFCITSFATQHSFATHCVQLRYEGLLLIMVVFDDGHFSWWLLLMLGSKTCFAKCEFFLELYNIYWE